MSTPATKPAAKKAAAKKAAPKAGAEPSKSDLVRKLAKELKEGGQQPRPSVIVAELAKQGVKVAPAQVSIVLKKMGFRPLRKKKGGAKKSPPEAAGAVRAPKPAASSAWFVASHTPCCAACSRRAWPASVASFRPAAPIMAM